MVDFGEDSEVSRALEKGVVIGEEEDCLRQDHVPVSRPSQAKMLEENQDHLEEEEEPRKQGHVTEQELEKKKSRVIMQKYKIVFLLKNNTHEESWLAGVSRFCGIGHALGLVEVFAVTNDVASHPVLAACPLVVKIRRNPTLDLRPLT